MTDVEATIEQIIETYRKWGPALSTAQLRTLLADLSGRALLEERGRNLSLLDDATGRLVASGGSGWKRELGELRRQVEIGTQVIPFGN